MAGRHINGDLEKFNPRPIKQFGRVEKNRRGVGGESIWRRCAVARINLARQCTRMRYRSGKVLFFEMPYCLLSQIRRQCASRRTPKQLSFRSGSKRNPSGQLRPGRRDVDILQSCAAI